MTHTDLADLRDLEDLEEQQRAGEQLKEEERGAENREAGEQLLRYKRLWESTTPEGSPRQSTRGRSSEAEERIVYADNRRGESLVENWIRNEQAEASSTSGSSSHTVTAIRGRPARTRSTPVRERSRNEEELQELIREEMSALDTRMTNLAERAHEELKEAVEAGLTVIQTGVQMQIQEIAEKNDYMKSESKAATHRLETALAEICRKQDATLKALGKLRADSEDRGKRELGQLTNRMDRWKSELDETHGAVQNVKRHARGDKRRTSRRVERLDPPAPRTRVSRRTTVSRRHVCQRWRRFRKEAPQVVIHNGIKTEVVDMTQTTHPQYDRGKKGRARPPRLQRSKRR